MKCRRAGRNSLNHDRRLQQLVEYAATVRQAADMAEQFTSEFGHPLDGHAELRPLAERRLELMRQQPAGLALAVIGAHAEAGDTTAVEMVDRAAAGVLQLILNRRRYSQESMYAKPSMLRGRSSQARLRSCHDARLGNDPH